MGDRKSHFVTIATLLIFCILQRPIAGSPIDNAAVNRLGIFGHQTGSESQNIEFVRSKRSTAENLQRYQDKLFELLNEYRQGRNLPLFVVDPALAEGAQAWAVEEATKLEMAHSCVECENYAEIVGKRRSSRPIPGGVEAGDWVYQSLFGDEEHTFGGIVDDEQVIYVGFGIAFVRNPEDNTYHSYVVARFARPPPLSNQH